MARLLAIDYGKKRTGIAVTDPMQIIASGLTTVATRDLTSFLTDYLKKEQVETIILGEPKQMNYTDSELGPWLNKYAIRLKELFPDVKIEREDERFTSKMAHASMLSSGMKKKQRQNKALVDEIAATIILQSYMDRVNNGFNFL
ncbi:Holliday junction DNA helicase RuvA [Nonlabens dokdonensis]|jgi:putative Holliday junction resolvase|uniref:Putative pre-16S rRNA nuclease n=1 Tax=Nonlabens dokdonensis TaxID=328515 RepID=A0A1Z8BGE6_9FLAO|nr:Holliday junction resolvase RuvX [Nonlabens dokdonensis]OUS21652.1 Holliday junction DNA helicase RuvA [Nonlabens dokdonensis]